jgi:DnaJ-class molecular chaperone
LVIKHPCTDCKATGILVQKIKEIIKIPPGVEDNGSITLKGKGN